MTTYYVKGGTGGSDDGSSLANAAESIAGLMTAQAIAGGDVILVDSAHAFNAGAAITWTLPETGTGIVAVLSVNTGASDVLTAGGLEQTGGNFAFTIAMSTGVVTAGLYVYGMTLEVGSNSAQTSADIISTSIGHQTWDGCTFWLNSTSASSTLTFGATSASSSAIVTLNNCTFRSGAATTTQFVAISGGQVFIRNCTISGSGGSPTTALSCTGGAHIEVSGCDFHLATNLITIAGLGNMTFKAFNTYVGTNLTTGTHPGMGGGVYEFIGCGGVDGGGVPTNFAYTKIDGMGTVSTSTSIYLTADSSQATLSNGTATPYSYALLGAANVTRYNPLYTPWMAVEVTSTGARTFTIKCADLEGAVLKNSDVWIEIMYMGGANVSATPQNQYETGANVIGSTISRDPYLAGSNRTDTNEAWTGITETDTYDVAVTATVDYQGYVYARVALGKYLSGNTLYADGKVRVS